MTRTDRPTATRAPVVVVTGASGGIGRAEEYDVAQRQLRGNLPQAFVHALLLESSIRLTHPWGDATS